MNSLILCPANLGTQAAAHLALPLVRPCLTSTLRISLEQLQVQSHLVVTLSNVNCFLGCIWNPRSS